MTVSGTIAKNVEHLLTSEVLLTKFLKNDEIHNIHIEIMYS